MKHARIFCLPVALIAFGLGSCALDTYHADLTVVHQGVPGCLDAACHPGFTAAGTVFRDLEGVDRASDVEITLIDVAGGETRVAFSGPTGLFWAEHALPSGHVTFRVGDQYSLAHEMPGHAECNQCHVPGGVDGSDGTLVAQDVYPPTLTSSSPAAGSDSVDLDAQLVLVFSEPLDPATVNTTTLRLQGPDGPHPLEVLFVDGSDTVVLEPTEPLLEASDYVVVVEEGVADPDGNGLEIQQQVALSTASDGTPRVVDSQPAAGEDGVDPSVTLTLWVEPALDVSTLDSDTVYLSDNCAGQGAELSWLAGEQAFTVRPLVDLPGSTTCRLTLDGLSSSDGVEQDGAWTLVFSTWPDGTAPHAAAAVPGSGTQSVPLSATVQLGWSEGLASETVSADALSVTTLGGDVVEGSTALQGQVMVFEPTSELPSGETLLVSLAAVPTDIAGNAGTSPAPWSFRVGGAADDTGPQVRGMEPAEGSIDVPVDVVLGLRLSEDPDLGSLDSGVRLYADDVEVPCAKSWDPASMRVEVQPLVELATTTIYELGVNSTLLDLSGNSAGGRALRFTTVSGGDAGAPIFDGVQSVDGVDTTTIVVSWNSATDFETSAADIIYHAYLATDSGGQDLDTPTVTSDPGATEAEIGDLVAGTTYYAVVRAEDADGNVDDNEVELSGSPLISFSELAHPIILDACYSCHGDSRTSGGLDVETWDSLMSSGTVIPYDSAGSGFMSIGNHHGSGWFTADESALVNGWIDQGALDN